MGKRIGNRTIFRNEKRMPGGLKPARVYIVVSLACLAVLMLVFLQEHGKYINSYFWCDLQDTGMDFFNSISYVKSGYPYRDYGVLYPPLANLLFRMLFQMIPPSISVAWADTFDAVRSQRGTALDLRMIQMPMIFFVLFIMLSTLMIAALTFYAVRKKKASEKMGVVFATVFSFPFLYAFERGNIIVLSWCLTMIFLLTLDHPQGTIRELGIVSLALSAGLKLYPALYGLLLLKERRFKDAVRAIVYGILSIVLPMLFMKEGIGGLRRWIGILFSKGSASYSGSGFISNMCEVLSYYGIEVSSPVEAAMNIALTAFLIFRAFRVREYWKSILFITLSVFTLFPQPGYGVCFYLLSLLLFIAEVESISKQNIIFFVIQTALVVNLPVFEVPIVRFKDFFVDRFGLQAVLMAMLLLAAFSECILEYKKKRLEVNARDYVGYL